MNAWTESTGGIDYTDPMFKTSVENFTCPDNIVQDAEQCDDNNTTPNDGCAANCKFFNCGDATLDGPYENCDDGNLTSGDGCHGKFCFQEAGFTCTGTPSACNTTCGDGTAAGTEQCDDGNFTNGDGCDDGIGGNCTVTGCGNGVLTGGETCDDGNLVNGDGCEANCTVTPAPICGNGLIEGAETCDDSNLLHNDGCSGICTVESPYTCAGTPSICTSPSEIVCNDGRDNDSDGQTDCADTNCALHCNANVGVCGAGQTALVFRSSDVPKAIPDNNQTGITSFITNGGVGVVQRAVMQVNNITHPFVEDLDIFLLAPDNTRVETSTNNGNSGANYTNTIFNTACATSIVAGTAPFTGCFSPEFSYATFNGKAALGNWVLNVADDASSDIGTLNAWGLALCVSQPP